MARKGPREPERLASVNEPTSALSRVDWDFPQSGNPTGSLHTLHRFPGNFIPQIPSFLIQILSNPGDIVLDPFAGSGTTVVEALKLGRHAIAADRLSVGVHLTRGKVAALQSSLLRQVISELMSRLTWDRLCVTDATGRNGEGSAIELRTWYARHTLGQLRYLWSLIETVPETVRSALMMLFADVLFACASTGGSLTKSGKVRRHHWGWVADNVTPKRVHEHNAIDVFRRRLSALWQVPRSESQAGSVSIVLQQDARHMALASESVDLVVTSPPYIGVIDYVRANRLFYLWMGWPLDEERHDEIGARYKRGRVRFADEYEAEIELCWEEICRVLRENAYCAIVIGESRKFQGAVNRALDRLQQSMALVWGPVARVPQRRRVSDRTASQPVEYICVFQK